MKTLKIIGIGAIVTYSVICVGIKVCDRIEAALQAVIKEKQEEAVEKVVDEFVTAAVRCQQFTIESKHHGKATVRLVVD